MVEQTMNYCEPPMPRSLHDQDYRPSGERMTPTLLAVADDEDGARCVESAAALAGVRVLACVDYAEARSRLQRVSAPTILLLELNRAGPDLLEQLLTDVGAVTARAHASVILCFDATQLDHVAAQAPTADAQLLCDPTLADRVAALALAARPPAFPDSLREAESDRLRRLNEEVARIAETLARLTRGDTHASTDSPVDTARDRRQSYRPQTLRAVAGTGEWAPEPQAVRTVIRARRLRAQFFNAELFADPAWDMLLDLFAAQLEHATVSVSSLCIAAAVPPTTALRWIATMTEAGLFERKDDPFDRRRAFVALSTTAFEGMRAYAEALRKLGLAFA